MTVDVTYLTLGRWVWRRMGPLYIGPWPYARVLAPYRGIMRYCTPTVGASPYAILPNPNGETNAL